MVLLLRFNSDQGRILLNADKLIATDFDSFPALTSFRIISQDSLSYTQEPLRSVKKQQFIFHFLNRAIYFEPLSMFVKCWDLSFKTKLDYICEFFKRAFWQIDDQSFFAVREIQW